MITEVIIFLICFLLLWYYWNQSPHKLPPGPRGLPLLGGMIIQTVEEARQLRQKYGNVIRKKTANLEIVLLCDYKLIKEVYMRHEFSDRPDWKSMQFLTEGREAGIIFSSGERWQNVRRFLLRHLRDLGMGKSYMDDAILEEAQMLVQDFKNHVGSPTHIPQSINIAALNIIWRLVANRRYDLNDPKLHEFIALNKQMQEDTTTLMLSEMFPVLNYLPNFIKRKVMKLDLIEEIVQKAKALFGDIIESHRKTLDLNDARDVIDEYLIEMEHKKSAISEHFSEEDLIRVSFDLFIAGFDTTSSTLRWIILYMASYPQIQRRVQEEIDSALPRDTLPSNLHKQKLPYLEATIHEVLRKSSLIPFGVGHSNLRDMQIQGYYIPKNTVILGGVALCHEDENYWENPQEFKPERFLDENGHFTPHREGFVPFLVGKRQCLGEALARMELFTFAAALLQNFTFASPPCGPVNLEPDDILWVHLPRAQDIVINVRK